jgi:hypothetical protein
MATERLESPQVFRAPVDHTRGGSTGDMSEWPSSYAPTKPPDPPMNTVIVSPGGHSIQLDDNPAARRVAITHACGSHVEMFPDGRVKYKSVNSRQDVTIGDHELMVRGDFNITVDGGSKIFIRNGSLEIQSDSGTAINVKGELKVSANNILMRATNKISLIAPFVDLGGSSTSPFVSLPYSMVPIFGIPAVVMSGLPLPSSVAGAAVSAPENGGSSLPAVATTVGSLVATVKAMAKSMNDVRRYAQLGIGGGVAITKLIRDSSGAPIVPEVEQPSEIPLSNPKLYAATTTEAVRLRDRQFDSPEDVNDTESYTAHLNVCASLGDFLESDKDLPGQLVLSDITPPASEPIPTKAFAVVYGTVSCDNGNNIVLGTNTKFTEELQVGQYLIIDGQQVKISAIQSDSVLALSSPWAEASVIGKLLYVHSYRAFSQFFGKYSYPLSTKLGTSSVTLQTFMKSFIPPTIEKVVDSVPVPVQIQQPTSSLPGSTSGLGTESTIVLERQPWDSERPAV